jgi:prepilin-type N-terminal cleavage/methylation domain-containing protein
LLKGNRFILLYEWQSKKGFTLVEILVATLILVFVGVVILQTFMSYIYFSAVNKERAVAMTDLSNMMETIISTPFSNIPARFPNSTQDGIVSNLYTNIVGGYTLKNEHITVTYVNSASDPLEIIVTLRWQDAKGLTQINALVTKRTK